MKNSQLPISIGILLWKYLKDVYNITSYQRNGLLSISNDIAQFFQEVLPAHKALSARAQHSYFLFLEHDEVLIKKNISFWRTQPLFKIAQLMLKGLEKYPFKSRRKKLWRCLAH